MRSDEEGQALTQVAERLHARFPHVDSRTINTVVELSHQRYDGRPIRDFIPILVEREARDRLHHLPTQRASQPQPDALWETLTQ